MRPVVLALVVLAALGGCTTRSGTSVSSPPPARPAPPVPPPATDAPRQPPRGLPAPPDRVCIPTYRGECMPADDFNYRVTELGLYEYYDHLGFRNQWGLHSINAHLAYGHMNLLQGPDAAPGAGVTVGMMDTGIDLEHPHFRGKHVREEFLDGAVDESGDRWSHGTAVASVLAGVRTDDPDAPHGVAWGADLAVFAFPADTAGPSFRPASLESMARKDQELAARFRHIFDWRDGDRKIDILNLSIGYSAIISHYTAADLQASHGALIAALAQADAAEKTILVWAAMNWNGYRCDVATPDCVEGRLNAGSVNVLAGLAAYFEELRGHNVAVVALSPDGGGISDFSNRCGIAADFCIAAPGERLRAAWFGPVGGVIGVRGYEGGQSGTSLAAPMVAGGLAIMKQIFRDQLSNEELVSRLFRTADDTGIYADRAVYGNGRLDLGAATSPVGVLGVPIETGVGAGAHASLQSSGLRLGAAFGDGFGEAFGDAEFMALDDFGAPFWYNLGNLAVTTDGPALARRLRTFLAPGFAFGAPGGAGLDTRPMTPGVGASVLTMPTAAPNGHLALAEGSAMVSVFRQGGISAAAFTTGALRPLMPATGAAIAWTPRGLPVGFRAGWIEERETVLGSRGQGLFGNFSAGTAFVGFDGGLELGGWRLGANGEFGVVNPAARGGVIEEMSPLMTSTFAVHASRKFVRAGSLGFSLSQPLRVERGWASLTMPSARTKRREVLYRSARANLAPDNRQLDLEAHWTRTLPLGELRLGALWSHSPGHREVLGPQVAALAGWRWAF